MAEEKIQRLVQRRREEQEGMLDVEKKKKECFGHFEKCFRELGFDTQARNLAVEALKNRKLHLREIIEEVFTHPPQLLACDLWIISEFSAFRVLLQRYRARGKRRGFRNGAAARHSQSARAHTGFFSFSPCSSLSFFILNHNILALRAPRTALGYLLENRKSGKKNPYELWLTASGARRLRG